MLVRDLISDGLIAAQRIFVVAAYYRFYLCAQEIDHVIGILQNFLSTNTQINNILQIFQHIASGTHGPQLIQYIIYRNIYLTVLQKYGNLHSQLQDGSWHASHSPLDHPVDVLQPYAFGWTFEVEGDFDSNEGGAIGLGAARHVGLQGISGQFSELYQFEGLYFVFSLEDVTNSNLLHNFVRGFLKVYVDDLDEAVSQTYHCLQHFSYFDIGFLPLAVDDDGALVLDDFGVAEDIIIQVFQHTLRPCFLKEELAIATVFAGEAVKQLPPAGVKLNKQKVLDLIVQQQLVPSLPEIGVFLEDALAGAVGTVEGLEGDSKLRADLHLQDSQLPGTFFDMGHDLGITNFQCFQAFIFLPLCAYQLLHLYQIDPNLFKQLCIRRVDLFAFNHQPLFFLFPVIDVSIHIVHALLLLMDHQPHFFDLVSCQFLQLLKLEVPFYSSLFQVHQLLCPLLALLLELGSLGHHFIDLLVS